MICKTQVPDSQAAGSSGIMQLTSLPSPHDFQQGFHRQMLLAKDILDDHAEMPDIELEKIFNNFQLLSGYHPGKPFVSLSQWQKQTGFKEWKKEVEATVQASLDENYSRLVEAHDYQVAQNKETQARIDSLNKQIADVTPLSKVGDQVQRYDNLMKLNELEQDLENAKGEMFDIEPLPEKINFRLQDPAVMGTNNAIEAGIAKVKNLLTGVSPENTNDLRKYLMDIGSRDNDKFLMSMLSGDGVALEEFMHNAPAPVAAEMAIYIEHGLRHHNMDLSFLQEKFSSPENFPEVRNLPPSRIRAEMASRWLSNYQDSIEI